MRRKLLAISCAEVFAQSISPTPDSVGGVISFTTLGGTSARTSDFTGADQLAAGLITIIDSFHQRDDLRQPIGEQENELKLWRAARPKPLDE